MDTRSQDSPVHCGKTNSTQSKMRSAEGIEKRQNTRFSQREAKKDEKRPIRRLRSPSRFSRQFRPRFGGRYYRPRFYPGRDDRFFRRPGYKLGFQRYSPALGPRLQVSTATNSSPVRRRVSVSPSPAPSQHSDKSLSATAREQKDTSTDTPRSSGSSSRERDRQSLSFTVSQDGAEAGTTRETLLSVTRAAARSRAIQRKREEIEEVYRQDCDTFGVVVKMLVAKDPSLERPIQSSLRENLRDIGQRCVEAMQKFIQEYDSREPSSPLDLQQL
ncbi:periphilin-1 [Chanos chanos]|uniref:Periphilin-1 n=1 Tax=Chanos chanos TaxID=29144 RepID=A0A6J2WBJ7_CHACN|nr:periphilin-1-like [Chanos chanos]